MNSLSKKVTKYLVLSQDYFYHFGLMQEFFNFIYNQNVQPK